MSLWSLLYNLPLYFEALKDYTTIMCSLTLFPQTFIVVPAEVVMGFLTTKTGKYKSLRFTTLPIVRLTHQPYNGYSSCS